MSVLVELSCGTLVVDLFVKDCPKACLNFLKLAKLKYYNNNLIFLVEKNFLIQSGDPTGTGKGGRSIFGILNEKSIGNGEKEAQNFKRGSQSPKHAPSMKTVGYFEDEIRPDIELNKKGLLCMANTGPNTNTSQFFVTLRGDDLEYLNGKHTIFGEVVEGLETLDTLGEVFVDEKHRPYQDVRILHTFVLDDPFPDPDGLIAPDKSPETLRPGEETVEERIAYGEDIDKKDEGRTKEEIEESIRKEQAKSRAEVLEMMGDLPDAEIKPPENVLFVCKLNPITMDEDLELIFSRFGEIKECEIIRDRETGESLQYAFIEFTTEEQSQEAYFKMNNVVVDDRRIKVDFSQSVAKIWNKWSMSKRAPGTIKPIPKMHDSKEGNKNTPHSYTTRSDTSNRERFPNSDRHNHRSERRSHRDRHEKHRHRDRDRHEKHRNRDKDRGRDHRRDRYRSRSRSRERHR